MTQESSVTIGEYPFSLRYPEPMSGKVTQKYVLTSLYAPGQLYSSENNLTIRQVDEALFSEPL